MKVESKVIQAILDANVELFEYINNNLTQEDYLYSDIIGEGGDRASLMDLKAEAIFAKHLLPYGDILSEESGLIISNSKLKIKNSKFVIDPLDGSDNFASHLPYFGSSVSYEINGEIQIAVICNLSGGECVIFEGDTKMEYDLKTQELNQIFASPNPQIAVFERAYAYPQMCQILNDLGIKFRSPGAVALTLANAHNYKFVLFAGKMREYDLKAGLFMTKDLYSYQSDTFLLISKNFEIFTQLKEIIKEL